MPCPASALRRPHGGAVGRPQDPCDAPLALRRTLRCGGVSRPRHLSDRRSPISRIQASRPHRNEPRGRGSYNRRKHKAG